MLEPDHTATWEDVADALQALDTSRTRVLDGLRAVLVMGEPTSTDGLARELRGRGGRVSLVDVAGLGIEEAREIDPEVLLVDPEALDGAGMDLARRLRDDPRLRWASVVRVDFRKAWPHGLPLLAGQIAPLVERDRALRSHVAEGAPFRCDLERIGPNRALRGVEGLGRALKISSSSAGAVAEVVIADELLVSASWWETGPASVRMTGVDALSAFLTMRRGRLEVVPGARLVGANVLMPVAEALFEAGQQMLGVIARVPTARYPRKLLSGGPRAREASRNAFRPDDEVTTQRYPSVRPPAGRIRRSGVATEPDIADEGEEETTQRLARSMLRPPAPSPAPPDRATPDPALKLEMPRRVRPTAPRAPVEKRPAPPAPPRPVVRPGRPPVPRSAQMGSRRPRPMAPVVQKAVAEAPPLPPPAQLPVAPASGPREPQAPRAPVSSLRPVSFEARRAPAPEPGRWPLRIVAVAAGVVAMTAVGYLAAPPLAELLSPAPSGEDRPAGAAHESAAPPVPAATPQPPAPVEAPAEVEQPRPRSAVVEEQAPATHSEDAPPVDAHAADLPENDRRAARELVERARRLGHGDRARALFEAALERSPRSARAMAGLAEIALARGDGATAADWARRALEISPRRASYHVLLGDALEAAGDPAAARRAWERANRLAPGHPSIRRRLAASAE